MVERTESRGDELLTAAEAAAVLGLKRSSLYTYASKGLLQSVPVAGSRSRGYRRSEVEALHARRRSGTSVGVDAEEH